MSLTEIADVVNGRVWLPEQTGTDAASETVADIPVVTGTVEFDTREIGQSELFRNGLFVALPGPNADGHDFVPQAVASGAAAVLAAREVAAPAVIVTPLGAEAIAHREAYLLAGDTTGAGAAVLAALSALAQHVVSRLVESGLTVIGITGSSGKTSTKDLIAGLLATLGPTIAPPGSYNNELGHPWTALRATESTKHLVLEMSARSRGHIAKQCQITPPHIGVVLNIGSAHLGVFGSQRDIAIAKAELIEALPPHGIAVLNADDPLVRAMAEKTSARVVFFGESAQSHVRAVDIVLDEQARASFTLITPLGNSQVTLALHGYHQVSNALAAAAVAVELGMSPTDIAQHLSQAHAVSAHRMNMTTRPDGVILIDDAYNANPESMKAALKALAAMTSQANPPRGSWAVLGPMEELEELAVAAHDEIGRLAVRLNINHLVVVGERARPMHQGAALEGSWGNESILVPDVEAAVQLLREQVRPGDVVLVKASNSYRLWRVAEALVEAVAE